MNREKTLHAGSPQNLFSSSLYLHTTYVPYVDLRQPFVGRLMDRVSIQSVMRFLMIDQSAQLCAEGAIPYFCILESYQRCGKRFVAFKTASLSKQHHSTMKQFLVESITAGVFGIDLVIVFSMDF